MLQDVACIPDVQRARPVVQCLWSSGPIRFEESPSALEHENCFSLSAPLALAAVTGHGVICCPVETSPGVDSSDLPSS